MKTLKILKSLAVFLSMALLISCGKEPIETTDATIDVVGTTNIKSGESTTLTAKVTNVSSGFILSCTPAVYKDGKEVTFLELTGKETEEDLSFSTGTLTQTKTFFFRITKDSKVVVSKKITVIVQVVPPPQKPIIKDIKVFYKGSLLTGELPHGDTVDIVCEFVYGTIYINDDTSSYVGDDNDSYTFENIFIEETTTLDFTVKSMSGEKVTESVTILVHINTIEDTLCNFGPWKLIKLEFQDEFGSWNEADISECLQDDLMKFNLTPTKKLIYDNGQNRCGSEPPTTSSDWFIEGSMINTGSSGPGTKEIKILSQITLMWVYNTGGNVRETYAHPTP